METKKTPCFVNRENTFHLSRNEKHQSPSTGREEAHTAKEMELNSFGYTQKWTIPKPGRIMDYFCVTQDTCVNNLCFIPEHLGKGSELNKQPYFCMYVNSWNLHSLLFLLLALFWNIVWFISQPRINLRDWWPSGITGKTAVTDLLLLFLK